MQIVYTPDSEMVSPGASHARSPPDREWSEKPAYAVVKKASASGGDSASVYPAAGAADGDDTTYDKLNDSTHPTLKPDRLESDGCVCPHSLFIC